MDIRFLYYNIKYNKGLSTYGEYFNNRFFFKSYRNNDNINEAHTNIKQL